jgi:alkanesulfonate monooxygenase SsuD/methylene tetrahydromethanopterin reductase-like flavin-dependent oxidoreductase (luciferase family)
VVRAIAPSSPPATCALDMCDRLEMGFPLRFHVLSLPNVPWDEMVARFQRMEELGIDVGVVADHLVDWTNPPSPWFESWTLLAALASATSTIRLGTCVAQIPLRNPAMHARQALTLDHISGGRIEVGLGTGLTIDPSYAMAGLPNWDAPERVARFAEYVEIVDHLLANEVTTFRGAYYEIDGAFMNPRPVQLPRPPIMVGAMGPAMMRHAARWADIWNSLSFEPVFADQIAETRSRCARMDTNCATIGRDPATLRRSYTMFDATARANGGSIGYYASPDACAAMIGEIVALGVSDVGLYYPLDPAQTPMFEQIAADLLPALRAEHADVG